MVEAYRGFDKAFKYLFDNATEVSATALYQSGTDIGSITIDGQTIDFYIPSGGGSTVSYNEGLQSGTLVGTLTIDGVSHNLYCTSVEANPQGSPTVALSSIEIDGVVYSIQGGGTTVIANPQGQATADLSKIQIGNDIYGVATPTDIATLQSNFQDGVDDIYDACVTKGSTPASTALSDVVQGILDIPQSGGVSTPYPIHRMYRFACDNNNKYAPGIVDSKYYLVGGSYTSTSSNRDPVATASSGTLTLLTATSDMVKYRTRYLNGNIYLLEKVNETDDVTIAGTNNEMSMCVPFAGEPNLGAIYKQSDAQYNTEYTIPTFTENYYILIVQVVHTNALSTYYQNIRVLDINAESDLVGFSAYNNRYYYQVYLCKRPNTALKYSLPYEPEVAHVIGIPVELASN